VSCRSVQWAAWNDVRSLTNVQAMESYCVIMEGLMSLSRQAELEETSLEMVTADPELAASVEGVVPDAHRPPPPPPPACAASSSVASSAQATAKQPELQPLRERGAAESSRGVKAAEPPIEDEAEPPVFCQRWETTSLTVAAGESLSVPLVVDEPSLCKYNLMVVSPDGSTASSIGFSLSTSPSDPTASAPPLVDEMGSSTTGSLELSLEPPHMLYVTLDNTAAYVTDVDVSATVTLEPLSQLAVLAQFRQVAAARAELRGVLSQIEAAEAVSSAAQSEEAALKDLYEAQMAQVDATREQLSEQQAVLERCERRKQELRVKAAAMETRLAQIQTNA